MTDVATNPAHPPGGSTSRSLPPPTPTSAHSAGSLHAMSTRSSDALARRQSIPQQQQHQPRTPVSSGPIPPPPPPEAHGLPRVEARLTRKRARSINVEEANHHRVDELNLQSPAVGGTPPSSASTVSNSDLICICPSPPKVPRPRNAFILYRQHHQAGVVLKYPGLANPDISKIIGEHWREEDEETKNYWKRLAEEEKARHQRQFPQYKYQPRRGGKGGAAARAASAVGEGGDSGRCPKCGGRYIATPRTPSTPFGGIPGPGHGLPGGGGSGSGGSTPGGAAASMQPFITNNPRVIETVHHHHPHPHHRQSMDSQHGGGGGGGGGDPRHQPSYYTHHPEPLRPIEEDYEGGRPTPSLARRRGPQHDDYDMMVTSPDAKRRRFGQFDRSPERGSPMAVMPQQHHHLLLHHHQGQQQQQQQYHHPSMSAQQQQQPPYTPHLQQQQQQHHPGARRTSAVSGAGGPVAYPGQTGPGGPYQMAAPLPRPREVIGGPRGGPAPPPPQQPQPQPQQQQRDMGMAPPPRPSRLSTAGVGVGGVPPPPPGLPAPPRAGGPASFDESLTLAPLQIPSSPTQASDASGGRSSSAGGLGMAMAMAMAQQQQHAVGTHHGAGGPVKHPPPTPARLCAGGDSQARGVEAMVMSIPYMNKLDVLRKISPALGPPGPGGPAVEARGPVIAIEGPSAALLREVRPVVERALRSSGECELRVWADSSVERAAALAASSPPAAKTATTPTSSTTTTMTTTTTGGAVGKRAGGGGGEDVEMADAQEKASRSRAGSVSAGSNSSTPRRGSVGGSSPAMPTGTRDYLLTILEWDGKSAEIVKHITTRPAAAAAAAAAASTPPPNNSNGGGGDSCSSSNAADDKASAAASSPGPTPVALIAGGFSLTLSDRFASTVPITDPYSPVDHWQWMATLWRGIVGPDLVVYAQAMTPEEEAAAATGRGPGAVGTVEYRAPGIMVVRVAGDRVDEKTERRLAFEVMEWVRAGSFRDGYSFGGGEGN